MECLFFFCFYQKGAAWIPQIWNQKKSGIPFQQGSIHPEVLMRKVLVNLFFFFPHSTISCRGLKFQALRKSFSYPREGSISLNVYLSKFPRLNSVLTFLSYTDLPKHFTLTYAHSFMHSYTVGNSGLSWN